MTIQKRSVKITIFVLVLASTILLLGAWSHAQPSASTPDVPSYSGFSAIDSSRNDFVVLGDTRGKSPWEFFAEKPGKIRTEILDEVALCKPAFVINLGDLVLRGGSARYWLEFDRLNAGIRQQEIPYFPILGNHEMQGNTQAGLRNYFTRFPSLKEHRWYSCQWKSVGFIMLDSNISTLTHDQRSEQIRWYNAELERFEADPKVKYVVACAHKPPFTNRAKTALGSESTKSLVEPFLKFEKTSLFFSGHVHSYERFRVGSKLFIVSGGGGAPRGRVVVDPAKQKYKDQFSGDELRFFHLCLVQLRGDSLGVRVLRLDPDGRFSDADRFNYQREGDDAPPLNVSKHERRP